MKKWILRIGIGFIALLLVFVVVLYVMLGSIVKSGAESVGPRITGTTVNLADASVNPLTGNATISGFVVGNPKEYKSPFAVRVENANITVDPGTLFDNPIVIEEFVITNAEINYELAMLKSNVGVILENIEESIGKSESETKVIIRHFLLEGTKVHLPNAEQTIDLQKVELKGIGEKTGGQTIAETSKQIAVPVIEATVRAVAENQGTLDRLKERGGNMLEGVKDVFK